MRGEGELNHSTSSVCWLSKRRNNNILGTVWRVKLKITGLVVRDVERTKRKYLYPTATAFTHTNTTVNIITTSITTTATKAKATNINFTATTTTATAITAGATAITTKEEY